MDDTVDVTVLFADVSGSTQLYEMVGDQIAYTAIEGCVGLMREKALAAGGRVIKTIGDEIMAAFPGPDAAADCAIEIQTGTDLLDPVSDMKLGVRIGLHCGPVVERDGDLFGDTVNVAARLAGLAVKNQIITSRETVNQLNVLLRAACRPLGAISVKGKANDVAIFEVAWREGEDVTTLLATKTVPLTSRAKLRLRYRNDELLLDDERRSLTLGRDKASAELVISDRMASRLHGRIERRLDKFVLIDHSANGTFVTPEGGDEVVLKREEIMLRGNGIIALGQSRAETGEVVEYFCD